MLDLRKLRFDHGRMTQDQLADLSGISQSILSNIERNPAYDMRISTLLALCNAFRMTPNQMLDFKFKE